MIPFQNCQAKMRQSTSSDTPSIFPASSSGKSASLKRESDTQENLESERVSVLLNRSVSPKKEFTPRSPDQKRGRGE